MTDKVFKNIGKFKQWTGEKFGNAKTTLQTEDFQRLEVETERKRIQYEKLHAAAILFQIQLGKKKPSPEDNNKSKRLPNDMLGVCLSNYGSEFTEETPLAVALAQVGSAQSRLAGYQEDFADRMKQDYMEKLEQGLDQFKEYQQLRKKLESRRLDYDAKLGRLQKSKKENPGLEQEMQAAKLKYEDSEYDVIQKMAALQEFEQEHCLALQKFLDLQFEYYTKSVEALNEVRANWGTVPAGGIRHARNGSGLARTLSNTSDEFNNGATTTRRTMSVRKMSNGAESGLNVPVSIRRPSQRSASFNSDYREEIHLPMPTSSPTMRTAPPPPPPVLPRRQSQSNNSSAPQQRKAIYEFGGENADELSFSVGDIITVVEEVDEGWWIGEAYGRRGIFPVNYTEVVVVAGAGPPPTMPSRPSLSSSASNSFIAEHPDEYVDEPSPFTDENRSRGAGTGYSYIRPNNNNQPARTLSNSTNSPMNSPRPATAQQQQTTTAKRAPPPPPPSSSSIRTPPPPVMKSSSSNNTTNGGYRGGARTAPTTPYNGLPQQQQSDNYFSTGAGSSGNNTVAACGDCGCDEFVANVFKKGHCNNCFHKHF